MKRILFACLALLGSGTAVARDLEARLATLLEQMPAQVRATAAAIPDLDRRLLAARAYVRAGTALQQRWSWSHMEAAAFASSDEGLQLQRAIAVVQCVFSSSNPGHALHVNPEFRNIEIQLQRWNTNASVGVAARRLLRLAARDLTRGDSAHSDVPEQIDELRRYLSSHAPDPVPTLAAPGLSAHGQARAVDFQVRRNDRIIAGTSAAAIPSEWEASGWTVRLAEAVSESGEDFTGPLQSPREPWHYVYGEKGRAADQPASDAARRCRQQR